MCAHRARAAIFAAFTARMQDLQKLLAMVPTLVLPLPALLPMLRQLMFCARRPLTGTAAAGAVDAGYVGAVRELSGLICASVTSTSR
jgi:hypothetical protein